MRRTLKMFLDVLFYAVVGVCSPAIAALILLAAIVATARWAYADGTRWRDEFMATLEMR